MVSGRRVFMSGAPIADWVCRLPVAPFVVALMIRILNWSLTLPASSMLRVFASRVPAARRLILSVQAANLLIRILFLFYFEFYRHYSTLFVSRYILAPSLYSSSSNCYIAFLTDAQRVRPQCVCCRVRYFLNIQLNAFVAACAISFSVSFPSHYPFIHNWVVRRAALIPWLASRLIFVQPSKLR